MREYLTPELKFRMQMTLYGKPDERRKTYHVVRMVKHFNCRCNRVPVVKDAS